MTTYGDQLFQMGGVPVGDGSGRYANPWSTTYFVDGDNGSDSNTGKTIDRSFKTIQKAVTTSTGGDVIYIKPKSYTMGTGFARYTEDVIIPNGATGSGSTATGANRSLIGVTPRRVASDFAGVRWTYASTTNLNVEAAGTHLENIGFYCEDATAAIYFEQDGATWTKSGGTGSSLYNCAIKGDGGILANGSDSLQIIGCQFQASYDGDTSAIIITIDGTNVCRRPVIKGNHFLGGNGTSMDTAPIICTGAVEDGLIADNDFGAVSGGVYINIATSTSSGLITRNFFATANLSTTYIVQDGMICVANYDLTGLAAGC